MTSPGAAREVALVAGAVALLTLPFVDRPFHIDDEVYLSEARQILATPLAPLSGTRTMFGETGPAWHFTQHPPLVSYLLAAGVRLAGTDERALHAAFTLFPLGAALGAWLLARRFTSCPAPVALLFLATPAFVVSSHSLMTDVPLLAFYLLAAASGVRAVDTGRPWLFVVTAALFALACFTQYRAVLLAPLLCAYAWLHGRGARRVVAALLPALGLLLIWSWWTWRLHGVPHPLGAVPWLGVRWPGAAADAVAYVSFLGGATLAPPILVGLGLAAPRPWLRGVAVAAATLAATAWATDGFGAGPRAWFGLFFASGLAFLTVLLPGTGPRAAWRERRDSAGSIRARDGAFLWLMAALPLASQVALNLFASARSLLLFLPFLLLLAVRRVEGRLGSSRTQALVAVSALLTAAYTLPIALADRALAESHRELAARIAALSGDEGWFTGEWGLRYYLEEAGLRPITSDGAGVPAGALVAVPEVACPAPLAPGFRARLRLEQTLVTTHEHPLRVLATSAHAGFHSNGWGPLPWSFAAAPLERVQLYRVTE